MYIVLFWLLIYVFYLCILCILFIHFILIIDLWILFCILFMYFIYAFYFDYWFMYLSWPKLHFWLVPVNQSRKLKFIFEILYFQPVF